MKISVVGAGAVGSTLSMRIVESAFADVVMVDVAKNMAVGKAFDLLDAAPIVGHERAITGTDNYEDIKGSGIVVLTAGLPRKPGMTREDLITRNAAIVRDCSSKVKEYAPDAILIVVTNPLDSMTYLAQQVTGFKRERVIGMAGVLDGSRFCQLIASELGVLRSYVKTYMLGSHGDTMVPVISKTTVNGKPISKLITKDRLEAVIKRTCDRGAEIVALLGSGSAYYSPSAAVFKMIDSIVNDKKEELVASVVLKGEYGFNDIAIGVPCRIGKDGIEEIIELELSDNERSKLVKSAESIKGTISVL